MHRIDGPGATPGNLFTEGDPVGGVAATTVTAAWMNDVQENLMAVLAFAGVTATKGRAADLLDALKGRLIGRQVFKASGTYTPTPGTTMVVVEALGGGGAGGGVGVSAPNTVAGPGGGGGGYGVRRILSGFSGVAVSIGAGGLGVNNSAGLPGSPSSFGALLTAGGGLGGSIGTPGTGTVITSGTPGVGGGATLADSGRDGGVGGIGINGPSFTLSGQGGSSQYGPGAAYGSATGTGVFNGLTAAPNTGGGGGGALGFNNGAGTFAKGGDGGSGIVIVWEYT